MVTPQTTQTTTGAAPKGSVRVMKLYDGAVLQS